MYLSSKFGEKILMSYCICLLETLLLQTQKYGRTYPYKSSFFFRLDLHVLRYVTGSLDFEIGDLKVTYLFWYLFMI